MKKRFHFILLVTLVCLSSSTLFSQTNRWEMNNDGSISWAIDTSLPHSDHIEMSGKRISCVLRYGVNADSSFHATRSLVWPMLRTVLILESNDNSNYAYSAEDINMLYERRERYLKEEGKNFIVAESFEDIRKRK